MPDAFDFSALFDEYRDEAQGQLALLDAALLRLEDRGALPEEERTALLRALHTLKGNSGMLGLAGVVERVHEIETIFRTPPAEWPQALLDPLFEAAAALRRVAERAGTDQQDEAILRLRRISLAGGLDAAPPAAVNEPPEPPATGDDPAPEPEAAVASEAESAGDVVRVGFATLDLLLNQVGELTAATSALDELLDRSVAALDAAGLRRPLRERLESLEQLVAAVRRTTMDLRLVPVGRALSRFPSLARDLARQEGKQVRVELSGEDVELDKSTVDALSEPLLHLVRNAVDHGLGTPEERSAAGKPPVGTLSISAERHGDRVRIEVADDGSGLDRERILHRAREVGLIAPAQTPPPEELDELIFAPGFSTRREATTVSGRGIGLEVVKRRAAALRGSLEVLSEPGRGTRFVLSLPLTVAVVPALLFEAGGETLALPSAEVEETVRRAAPERAGGAEVVRHRGELLPLARTAQLLGWSAAPSDAAPAPTVIVVRQGARAAAVSADRLLEQRDILVRPLPRILGSVPTVSGVAVAPDGRPILLLDVSGVLDLNLVSHRRGRRAESR